MENSWNFEYFGKNVYPWILLKWWRTYKNIKSDCFCFGWVERLCEQGGWGYVYCSLEGLSAGVGCAFFD